MRTHLNENICHVTGPEVDGNIFMEKKPLISGRAPVAHACYPSYSRDRDQEDHGSKPAPGK
jgi:hypothetical protein